MASRLLYRRAVDLHARKHKKSNGREVHYVVTAQRQSFGPITAVPGRNIFDATELGQINAVGNPFDWLFLVDDLVNRGQPVTPIDGDQIICIWDEWQQKVTYDVRPQSGEIAYARMDAESVMYRVHTVVSKIEPLR